MVIDRCGAYLSADYWFKTRESPCGGYMAVLERDGGEGQRLSRTRVPLNGATGAAAKQVGIGRGLAHLHQAFVNADQPEVASLGIDAQPRTVSGGNQVS